MHCTKRLVSLVLLACCSKAAGSAELLRGYHRGGCDRHYTCCASFDFFIPMGETCVENTPSSSLFTLETANCARNGQGKVEPWMRFETKKWRRDGVCTKETPKVTLADLDAKEKKQREWNENYEKFCGAASNAANCTQTETCFFDQKSKGGDATITMPGLPKDAPACVCQYPRARSNTDGTGACVQCSNDINNQTSSVYVLNTPGNASSGAHVFSFGIEFACAFGSKASSRG